MGINWTNPIWGSRKHLVGGIDGTGPALWCLRRNVRNVAFWCRTFCVSRAHLPVLWKSKNGLQYRTNMPKITYNPPNTQFSMGISQIYQSIFLSIYLSIYIYIYILPASATFTSHSPASVPGLGKGREFLVVPPAVAAVAAVAGVAASSSGGRLPKADSWGWHGDGVPPKWQF